MAGAYEENLRSLTLEADSSLGIYTGVPGMPGSAVPNGGKQFCGVKIVGTNTVGLNVAASTACIGIIQNKPQKAGAAATVGYEGVSQAVAGAAVSAGVEVVCDSTGRFIAGTGSGGARRFFSLTTAAGAGELFAVFIA